MELLTREKEATHAKDAVDAARRELPMTEVTKDYTFTGPNGQVSLPGLFDGRRQLITYHFMWRHEQSAYERGLDTPLGTYRWLELPPSGRQKHVIEFPHHDTYDHESA
jgi:predicted dithiol-disulfide oxidoreductase (DUF899 family)